MPIEAEGLSDQDLFEGATSDEAAVDETVAETPEAPVEPTEQSQPRDEQGRFAEAPEAQEEQPRAERIPLAEYLSEREKRQTFENELKAEREQRQSLERRLAEKDRPPEKAEEEPDPLLEPKRYREFMEARFEARFLNERREIDLRLTRQTNVEIFDKAYEESQRLKAARDPAFLELSQKMNNTNAPGSVLLDWYKQRVTQAEIGGDLNGYKQKYRDELLKDPEFRKAATEAWRETPQNNGRPRVDLPPSLNGASRSNALLKSTDGDVSDHELFREIAG